MSSVYAIDPGLVHTGMVRGDSKGKVLQRWEMSGEDLIGFLQSMELEKGIVVVVETVTPRRMSFPGQWSQTIKIAMLIGRITQVCIDRVIPFVLQNPHVVRGLKKKGHVAEAEAHYLYYLEHTTDD